MDGAMSPTWHNITDTALGLGWVLCRALYDGLASLSCTATPSPDPRDPWALSLHSPVGMEGL